MRVLVTGGAGYLGSHLIEALRDRGDDAVVLDLVSQHSPAKADAAKVEYQKGDVRQLDRLALPFDLVFHLAATSRVAAARNHPLEAIDLATRGTAAVLVAAALRNNARVVYASSGGCAEPERSAYAHAKWLGEETCKAAHKHGDANVVMCRIYSTYGGRLPASGARSLIMATWASQLSRGLPITVYGYGEQQRDFIHVSDVIAGLLAAADRGVPGSTYQLGTGVATSIAAIASRIGAPLTRSPMSEDDATVIRAPTKPYAGQPDIGWTPTRHIHDHIKTMRTAWESHR